MSESADPAVQVDPTVEAAVRSSMSEIEAAATSIAAAERAASPHPTAAAINAVFLTHFNNLPVACETDMRPIIEAARKDLLAQFAVP